MAHPIDKVLAGERLRMLTSGLPDGRGSSGLEWIFSKDATDGVTLQIGATYEHPMAPPVPNSPAQLAWVEGLFDPPAARSYGDAFSLTAAQARMLFDALKPLRTG